MADKTKKKKKLHSTEAAENHSPRMAFKSFFSCKHHHGCTRSIFNLKDNTNTNTNTSLVESPKKRVSVGSSSSRMTSSRSLKAPLSEINGGSFRGMHLRRFSGCYECHHMVVDPLNGFSKVPSLRSSISPCPDCGEMFMKPESLELHQSVRHAVTELGVEDTSRNIVEIIFQSSWLKRQGPMCRIERILKVQNTQRTITRFEDYRDLIKSKANKLAKKHPRCIADGNELLRFYCTSIKCSLGSNGCTNLCDLIPHCSVCSIVRDGFKTDVFGKIRTMATSGRAHDCFENSSKDDVDDDDDEERRAMLVCRVIAGRVKKNQDGMEDQCDSVAGLAGVYSNLDELFVFNSKAILPCFVVIYGGF